ncbi:Capsule biosynthesis protein capA [Fulvivirga imtechensis AK7]|uniref:Capsule biosynthesis protein capA n=1 Tax=Fulvivirga imtechensis AK7 TaxID=1237149 RepID=L8JXN1_9BACT|nr:CapA family protein [Fulvivirga imtechensis]ELR73801.1 Capsule biosynthesis protein capA [Fulvivirga imtechensis AK7]
MLSLIFSACKVAQRPGAAGDQPEVAKTDTVTIPVDTTAARYIPDTVELNVHRIFKDTVSIIGVGDIMLGTNFPESWYLPPDEGRGLLAEVTPILQNADITFGNLEGVILNEGGDPKYCKDPKICYIFRSPEYMAQRLKEAGFDVMSTANNHAGDFGDPGRLNTMRTLDSLGIEHAGLLTRPFTTFEMEGMKYGFAAFAPNTGTVSINDLSNAGKIIAHLDSISDIVIVSFHGGAEGSKYQHVTRENEYFYGENRGNVYEFAHHVIDAGADVVFGHGPHVTRAVEVYKERFISYSLGNFATYARFNLRGDNGLAPIIKVFTNSEGKFLYAEVTPIIQHAPGGPSIDPEKQVIRRLQQLTEKDFPEVKIKIDDSGIITYIQD